MKSKFSLLSLAAAAMLCLTSGCALFQTPVPTTSITGTVGGQAFTLNNPKNTSISNLSVSVATNGTASLTIGTLTSVNDSNVIDAAYAGQAAIVTATGTAITQGIQSAATAAGAFVGTAAKAP